MKLRTLEHTDVRGNKLYYLVITNKRGTEFMLNVGERTVKTINKLNEEDATPMTPQEAQELQKQKEGNK